MMKRLTTVNALLLAAIFLIETFVAERHWLAMFVTYAPQFIYLVPLPVLAVWAAARREWRLVAANCALGLIALPLIAGFNIPVASKPGADAEAVRILTYNIRHGDKGASAICDVIREQNADIVCLQEVGPDRAWPDPAPEIKRLLPRGSRVVQGGELMIITRHTILSHAFHQDRTNGSFGVLEAVADVRGKRLAVLTTHLGNISPLGLVRRRHGRPGVGYVREQMDQRGRQMDYLLGIVQNLKGAFVITGDFNTPPAGLLYRRASSEMQDSFAAAGWGFGNTFRTNLPFWRIDYIFTDRASKVRRSFVPDVDASNHRPVVADVVL